MTKSIREIPIHPLLKKQANDDLPLVGLRGYRGPADKGRICIHKTLSPTCRVVEVVEDAVVRAATSDAEEAPSVFFLDPRAEVFIGHGLRVPLSNIINLAMTVSPRGETPCNCSGGTAQAARAPSVPIGNGPQLPPLWCEINCEQWLNSCLFASHGPWDRLWCWVDLYVCRLGCIYGGDTFSPGQVIR